MLSLYEILKASKTGIAPDMWTALAGMNWGGADSGHEVKELTGIPPLSIRSNGTMLLDYLISGNLSQSGAPTSDSPIQPQETGERTGNLFDEVYSDISGTIRYRPIFVGDGTFTLSTTTPYDSGVANVFLLSGNVSSGATTTGNGAWKNHNVIAQSVDGYVTIAYRQYSGATSPVDCQTMLNLGSTALPYENFGYKIPISSAGQTNNIYLGEVPTTRKIKKLVLTGEENWKKSGAYAGSFYAAIITRLISEEYSAYCSHLTFTILSRYTKGKFCFNGDVTYKNCNLWFNQFDSSTTVEDFKSYLAAQYAAGTPVTLWYVLATEETGIVNEPIRKIGDYADTVSMEQAGVQIPTLHGNTVIDVDTTLKPSEMYIKYQE